MLSWRFESNHEFEISQNAWQVGKKGERPKISHFLSQPVHEQPYKAIGSEMVIPNSCIRVIICSFNQPSQGMEKKEETSTCYDFVLFYNQEKKNANPIGRPSILTSELETTVPVSSQPTNPTYKYYYSNLGNFIYDDNLPFFF